MTTNPFRADVPFNELPNLPPAVDLESHAILKACIPARAALAELNATADLHQTTVALVCEKEPKIYSRELIDVVFEQPYCRISNLVEAGSRNARLPPNIWHGWRTSVS